MSKIGEFIKNLFSRFQKTKMLPDTVPEDKAQSSKIQMSGYQESIKVEVKETNPLSPEVCRGDKFMKNILKSLGVKDEITSNERLMSNMTGWVCNEIMDRRKKAGQEHYEFSYSEPSAADIHDVIEYIKAGHLFDADERQKIYDCACNEATQNPGMFCRCAIQLDGNGGFTVQRITGPIYIVRDNDEETISGIRGNIDYLQTECTALSDGRIAENSKSCKIGKAQSGNGFEECYYSSSKHLYGKDGIEVQRAYETLEVVENDINGVTLGPILYKYTAERDNDIPACVKFQSDVDNRNFEPRSGEKHEVGEAYYGVYPKISLEHFNADSARYASRDAAIGELRFLASDYAHQPKCETGLERKILHTSIDVALGKNNNYEMRA